MTTMYNTPRGESWDPMPLEVWTWQGQPVGRLQGVESASVVWRDGSADTAKVTAVMDDVSSLLVPCDGAYLLVARLNGQTHVSVPVDVSVEGLDDDPTVSVINITTAGGYTLLDGELVPSTLEDPVYMVNGDKFTVTGALEDVAKRLIRIGVSRTLHPVVVLPSLGRGPTVTVTGEWEKLGDLLTDLFTGSGWRLTVHGWAPGDQPPAEDIVPSTPVVLVDVGQYTPVSGLEWSAESGDITAWSYNIKRATATRAVIAPQQSSGDSESQIIREVVGNEPTSPWARREVYIRGTGYAQDDENRDPLQLRDRLDTEAATELAKADRSLTVDVTVELAAVWEAGTDHLFPRQFWLGDMVTVRLPGLDPVYQAVTEIEATLTPDTFTVRPTVGTVDTIDPSLFGRVADMNRRMTRLEKRS